MTSLKTFDVRLHGRKHMWILGGAMEDVKFTIEAVNAVHAEYKVRERYEVQRDLVITERKP